MTPVPYPIAHALIEGLSADSVVQHPQALNVFPEIQLVDFDTATKDTLEKTHPDHIERIWGDGGQKTKSLKHEGCFILHNTVALSGATAIAKAQSKREISREHYTNFFGELWIEHHIEQSHLTQTVFFSPHGLPGFLYWILLYPFHWLRFRGLMRKIENQL